MSKAAKAPSVQTPAPAKKGQNLALIREISKQWQDAMKRLAAA